MLAIIARFDITAQLSPKLASLANLSIEYGTVFLNFAGVFHSRRKTCVVCCQGLLLIYLHCWYGFLSDFPAPFHRGCAETYCFMRETKAHNLHCKLLANWLMHVQDLFKDPVIASDGFTYERYAIEDWLTRKATSPMTNEPLVHKFLIPNHNAKQNLQILQDWKGKKVLII